MIDTYLPGAISKGSVSTIDFTPVKHSDGCHADLVIYLPVKTYFCTDLYFVVRPSVLICQCAWQEAASTSRRSLAARFGMSLLQTLLTHHHTGCTAPSSMTHLA